MKMLTRIYGKVQFECDNCGEVLNTDTAEFSEALARLRVERWTVLRQEEWEHRCPKCQWRPRLKEKAR